MYVDRKSNKRKRLRTHGFRRRMLSVGGRNIIKRRRAKGRAIVTVSNTAYKYGKSARKLA